MTAGETSALQWLSTGREIFPAMLAAIAAARESVRLETYIYTDGALGQKFLDALLQAQQRGVRVRVLVDALGSWLLTDDFFAPLTAAGAEVRRFNPLRLWRFGVRDHRKLLVCDDRVAFVGGFNLTDEYDGDGIARGWRDLGVRLENPALVAQLAASFDDQFALADFHRKPLLRLRPFKRKRRTPAPPGGELLLSHPGRGPSPIQSALHRDLAQAQDVWIVTAYFLPTWRMRRSLVRVARRGGRVQLILAGKSDVLVSQLAGQHLYRRLLRAGVEIYEYQPQILHAKLMVIDRAVYVGSANFDIRSLKLNYELMLRFENEAIAATARSHFDGHLEHCQRIERAAWRRSRGFWQRLKSDWAYFLLARVDPYVALKQFHALDVG
jgi:cardiolipin synthase A/B